ncbi:tetratricopeptide repeat protein 7B-like [Salvelinus fontinalis]|uniref:tetratricopeptide repeat protein 7B-like n=1 Tax=Salvelinus fontinalis TaxID=8038 RepID=UPI002486A789|nr:tetratricopeptide repeat protein 7B-like [Salvelinus fontinalis]
MGKPAEATAFIQEAANLFPMSHNVLFTRGQVAELRGNVDEAKRWYEEALSISPTHVKTMQRLDEVLLLPHCSLPSSHSLRQEEE